MPGRPDIACEPYGHDASQRISAILYPQFPVEKFREEVRESIALSKRLKAAGKAIKLKLYSDPPLVKLAILGDDLWLEHYHTDLHVQTMPEYVFQHNLNDHGLYTLFYQYLVQRWGSPDIAEYDFETNELVYGGHTGNELVREQFGMAKAFAGVSQKLVRRPDLISLSCQENRAEPEYNANPQPEHL